MHIPTFFLITDIISVVFILFLLYVLSAVWPPDSPWAPWWQTPKDICRKMARLAKVGKKDKIYDLGCGSGSALIIANREFGAKGIGIEIDPARVLWAKWNVWRKRAKGIQIVKKNFFDVNLSDATVLYIYLVPNALKRLVPKFMKELKPGTQIVSYVYDLPEVLFKGKLKLVNHDKENKVFLYEVI